MTDQGLFQGGQDCQSLLAQGGEIAANAAEGHGTSRRAETTGDLLLDLDHTQIALGKAVDNGSAGSDVMSLTFGHGVVETFQQTLIVENGVWKINSSTRLT